MRLAAGALLVVARTATAAPDPDPVPAFVPGRLALRAAGELGRPSASLALDGWFDVNERFRLGVTMSDDARHRLAAGRGLCLTSCGRRVTGLAVDAQARLGPGLVGRAALDTTRLSPTAAALELGADLHLADGRWSAMAAPVLRLGISRRDLANRDSGALLGQLGVRAWPSGGVLGLVRAGVDLDNVRATPTLGTAAGAWLELGDLVLGARFGLTDVAHAGGAFGELALAWST